MNRFRSAVILVLAALGVAQTCSDAYGTDGSRRVHVGDPTPEFSVVDVTGQTYTYQRGSGRVLLVAFLSEEQIFSSRAKQDLERILGQLGDHTSELDFVVSTDDPNAFRDLLAPQRRFAGRLILTLDSDHKLWGSFGAIAIPTIVICDKTDHVLWIKAGYGYNFAPVVRARLNQALGIAQSVSPEAAGEVQIAINDSLDAQVQRLVQAAELMSSRGHFDAAIQEVEKARRLDPNSVDVPLELGELYCRSDRGSEAIALLAGLETQNRRNLARKEFLLGWALRQTGNMEGAEKALLHSIELNKQSAQTYFELGRVYEQRGNTEKALGAYRQALALVFGH